MNLSRHTLGSRTSTFSTPTTAPPSQAKSTLTSMTVARVQLAMSAQLPAVKFYPTTPPPVRQAATNEQRAATPPGGAFQMPGVGTSIGPTRPGSSSGTRSSSGSNLTTPEQAPAAPSEVVGDIERNLQAADVAAAQNDDPTVPATITTAPPASSSSGGWGSKILLGAGIVLGGILVFRLLK